MKSTLTRFTVALCLAIAGILAVSVVNSAKASAISGAQWQPGYIIDDGLFFSPNLMGASDIQTFLSAKVPVCDNNGTTGPHNGYPSRAQYAAATGNPGPPYTCLKDYVQNVPGKAADTFCPNAIAGGTKSAAMIISEVAWGCGINPQVLIVLLQKEQSLVTDDWPWPIQYQSATGFGCPDTAECDSQYYGFFNQVYNAARQFQRYVKEPQNFNYRAGATSNILWNVASTGCGGQNVYIQNNATAALYNYTPYQPNQAALNNLYGSGDGCSAYGNRNFWRMFNDWFGPSMGSLVKTANDNTVYLLNGTKAHPINDMNILNDYANLGPVRITSASEINAHSAGQPLGRMVGSQGGTLYLVNASIKLPFTNCNSVADYGYSCGSVTYLSDLLLNKLHNGPQVTPLLRSPSTGAVYYVTGTSKRPILNWSELESFHIPSLNTLTDKLIDHSLHTNSIPAHGSGVLVKTPNSPTVYIVRDIDTLIPVSNFIYPSELGLSLKVRTTNSTYNVASPIENKIKCGSTNYLATGGSVHSVSAGMLTQYGYNSGQFKDAGLLCYNVPVGQALDRYIRSPNGTIYYVTSGQKQPFSSYQAYVAHGGTPANTINVSNFFAGTLPTGAALN